MSKTGRWTGWLALAAGMAILTGLVARWIKKRQHPTGYTGDLDVHKRRVAQLRAKYGDSPGAQKHLDKADQALRDASRRRKRL